MQRLILSILATAAVAFMFAGCSTKEAVSQAKSGDVGKASVYLPKLTTTTLAKSLAIDPMSRFELVIQAYDMQPLVYSWDLWNLPTGPVTIENIPAGYSREFIGRLYNSQYTVTHEGSAYADIYADQTVTIYLRLLKKNSGGAIICVEIEGYSSPCMPQSTCDTITLGDSICTLADSLYSRAWEYCYSRNLTLGSIMFLDSCPTGGDISRYRYVRFTACSDTFVPPPVSACDTVLLQDSICRDTLYWYNIAMQYSQSYRKQISWISYPAPCGYTPNGLPASTSVEFILCDTIIQPPPPPPTGIDTVIFSDSGACRDSVYWMNRMYSYADSLSMTINWSYFMDPCTLSRSREGYRTLVFAVTPRDTMPPYQEPRNPLSLITPNGGEHYTVNDSIPIMWYSDSMYSEQVAIEMTFDYGNLWTIARDTITSHFGSNFYSWKMPPLNFGFQTTSGCKVRIYDINASYASDTSDSFFTIESQPQPPANPCGTDSIRLSSPLGGQTYHIGDTMQIQWCANPQTVPACRVAISVNGGNSWLTIPGYDSLAVPALGTNHYSWVIPNTINRTKLISKNCLIRVSNRSWDLIDDRSDTMFTIAR